MTTENRLTHEELERQAESIMDNFDFERVYKHMEAVAHKWNRDGEMIQPTIDDLRINARRLLTYAIWSDEHCANVGTGGFVAYKLPWGLRLTFELTWS